MLVSRSSLLKALSGVSINLASGWLGVLLISPGFLGVSISQYVELLLLNLPPAILSLVLGIMLLEKGG